MASSYVSSSTDNLLSGDSDGSQHMSHQPGVSDNTLTKQYSFSQNELRYDDVDEDTIQKEDDAYKLHEGPIPIPVTPKWQAFCSQILPFCCLSLMHDFKESNRLDMAFLVSNLLTVPLVVTAVVAFIMDRHDCRGQCLLAAEFFPAGIMLYSSTSFWCDASFYGCLVGGCIFFIIISINWMTDIKNHPRWLYTQVILVVFGLCASVLGTALLGTGFVYWCEHLVISVTCLTDDKHCVDRHSNANSVLSCHKAADLFDKKYANYDSMSVVFQNTVLQMAIHGVVTVMWMVSTFIGIYKCRQGIITYREVHGRIMRFQ